MYVWLLCNAARVAELALIPHYANYRGYLLGESRQKSENERHTRAGVDLDYTWKMKKRKYENCSDNNEC